MTNRDLINEAVKVLNPYKTEVGRLIGDVGAALLSGKGKIFVGTSVDTPGWGICAERSAIAAMITEGEYKIERIVAVWKDDKTGKLHILPPCGICREFMRQVDPHNLDTEVILGKDSAKKLKDLIPFYQWPDPLD